MQLQFAYFNFNILFSFIIYCNIKQNGSSQFIFIFYLQQYTTSITNSHFVHTRINKRYIVLVFPNDFVSIKQYNKIKNNSLIFLELLMFLQKILSH